MSDQVISSQRTRAGSRREYWVFYTITFLLALPVLGAARLLPWRIFGAHNQVRPSVLAEARSAASVAAGYACMG